MDISTSGAVSVCVRLRPLLPAESVSAVGGGEAFVLAAQAGSILDVDDARVYSFDRAYGPAASTREVFAGQCAPVVAAASRGVNGAILTLGQAGGGKTFTMFGGAAAATPASAADVEERGGAEGPSVGVAFLAAHALFRDLASQQGERPPPSDAGGSATAAAPAAPPAAAVGAPFSFLVRLSVFEVVDDEVVDLLPLAAARAGNSQGDSSGGAGDALLAGVGVATAPPMLAASLLPRLSIFGGCARLVTCKCGARLFIGT
jgi:hypothetical protein